jgi:hypothetical protein
LTFSGEIVDPDVVRAFNQKLESLKVPPDLRDVLTRISEREGWSEEDISFLASTEVDQYRSLFKDLKGDVLRSVLSGVLMFANVANATPAMQETTRRAKAALELIATESTLNARRVRSLLSSGS